LSASRSIKHLSACSSEPLCNENHDNKGRCNEHAAA
jgi:hypothetical protein